ncbi:unnamed protein product [Dicrocoelium dendriticum]|nr:unnamed protein product [Dicrocoelium dendriticum]
MTIERIAATSVIINNTTSNQVKMQQDATLVNKRVQFYCQFNRCFEGVVYTVDPASGNYVIFPDPIEHPSSFTILSAWSVEKTVVVEELPSERTLQAFDSLSRQLEQHCSTEPCEGVSDSDVMADRKARILQLFRSNQMDVTLQDVDIVTLNGLVSIHPPYTPESCTGSNVIVLDRVRKLIQSVDS